MPTSATAKRNKLDTPMNYIHETVPEPGVAWEVAPGVHWIRMPLPFDLNHINLWLLEDGDGWTIIDTGFADNQTRDTWESVLVNVLDGRPVKRLIVTHFHPDHIGLAGWLEEKLNMPMVTTQGEWAIGRMLFSNTDETIRHAFTTFYQRAGFGQELLDMVGERGNPYPERVVPLPVTYQRIMDGDTIEINGHNWRVITGYGHAPEHASLVCEELNVLISGDQVLPRITTNISVWPQEPLANPLKLFLDSLKKFEGLAEDILVLPSHDRPFTQLNARLEQLAHHHDQRLEELIQSCTEPHSAFEVLQYLFRRKLNDHQLFFAIGEAIAHLHYLVGEGRMTSTTGDDGVVRFKSA